MADLTEDEHAKILEVLRDVNPGILEKLEAPAIGTGLQKFREKLDELQNNGPTAKLWVQYFNMVTLVKKFVQAERSGDWQLHLQTIKGMLPYFHASGHYLYAKSCHLYLQDMSQLESKLTPQEYELFVSKGFFTIRRSDKFYRSVRYDHRTCLLYTSRCV